MFGYRLKDKLEKNGLAPDEIEQVRRTREMFRRKLVEHDVTVETRIEMERMLDEHETWCLSLYKKSQDTTKLQIERYDKLLEDYKRVRDELELLKKQHQEEKYGKLSDKYWRLFNRKEDLENRLCKASDYNFASDEEDFGDLDAMPEHQ